MLRALRLRSINSALDQCLLCRCGTVQSKAAHNFHRCFLERVEERRNTVQIVHTVNYVHIVHCSLQHLLCLVLQCLACLALSPEHHAALGQANVVDALLPLLLPSDEYYYTNHSTRYARYIKCARTRLSVFAPLLLCSSVSVYDTGVRVLLSSGCGRRII